MNVTCLQCDKERPMPARLQYNDFCLECLKLPELAAAIIGASKSGAGKERLYRLGLKEPRCEECGIVEWRGRPAPLELDHINGDKRDHNLWNLRILCGNCHRQTETWGPRNHVDRKRENT